jgi:hypothetical protein
LSRDLEGNAQEHVEQLVLEATSLGNKDPIAEQPNDELDLIEEARQETLIISSAPLLKEEPFYSNCEMKSDSVQDILDSILESRRISSC